MDEGCGHDCSCHEEHDEADRLLWLAHRAKRKLLMEKMKQEWEKRKGAELSKKAAAAVEALIAEWDAEDAADERHEKLLGKLR